MEFSYVVRLLFSFSSLGYVDKHKYTHISLVTLHTYHMVSSAVEIVPTPRVKGSGKMHKMGSKKKKLPKEHK